MLAHNTISVSGNIWEQFVKGGHIYRVFWVKSATFCAALLIHFRLT